MDLIAKTAKTGGPTVSFPSAWTMVPAVVEDTVFKLLGRCQVGKDITVGSKERSPVQGCISVSLATFLMPLRNFTESVRRAAISFTRLTLNSFQSSKEEATCH